MHLKGKVKKSEEGYFSIFFRIKRIINLAVHLKGKVYLFSWDSVPGDDNEKLIRFLRDDFDIDWVENVGIRKSNDGTTISISKDANSAEIMMDEKKEKAILKISDGRTHGLKVKTENGKLNMYGKLKKSKKDYLSIFFRVKNIIDLNRESVNNNWAQAVLWFEGAKEITYSEDDDKIKEFVKLYKDLKNLKAFCERKDKSLKGGRV